MDEAQFFDANLTEVCTELANNGIRVIVAGLDMDFKTSGLADDGPGPRIILLFTFRGFKENSC